MPAREAELLADLVGKLCPKGKRVRVLCLLLILRALCVVFPTLTNCGATTGVAHRGSFVRHLRLSSGVS